MLSLFENDTVELGTATAREGAVARKSIALDKGLPAALSDEARVLFLDVETTGLSWFYDEITIVGWAVNGEYKALIAGDDPKVLIEDLAAAKVIVTFNGTLFDLRFLRKKYGYIRLPETHIDLRFLSRRAGLSGGQKHIERLLDVRLREGLEDIDGAAAVLLWHEHLRGSDEALKSLIMYNRSDVLAMMIILDRIVAKLQVQADFWLRLPNFCESANRALKKSLPTFQLKQAAERRIFRSFASIFSGTRAEAARIVGIDLTGSEKRGSGWCLLIGSEAHISTKFTDQEMIEAIVEARPDLVSIDSPLSIPFGRRTVSDDDPTRAEFGIMRRCERELKRRGINVYPSLLPSMQGLTRRGMSLAARIREHGIPVIESYPGAAQDIIGIPRKGAGIEYLERGLSEFGIEGFEGAGASHDELDAITAALVGSFFLAGKFEALSGPTEGALIVPDLSSNDQRLVVVGISGRICAGKTTAAQRLERQGFAYSRFSMVIDDQIRSAGGVLDRQSRQTVGEEIHRVKGQRWLCEKVLEKVAGKRLIVIDGLRFPEDHAFLLETFGASFLHVHISASTHLRQMRYQDTQQGPVSFNEADRQPVESKIELLEKLAHKTITNDGSIAELEEELGVVVEAIWKDAACLSQLS
ncbi:DUF429 domain-containing protein [Bradyrhizobium sp. IC3069]|uniref:ribonuclease H-like domain-containing protein n=1 Tax=unclassified Bradyrhizobium TaxID=2631580 RepID=UPI001CD4AE1E|nr:MULTISPECIES: ribonuclease H-like domain-containing protein [unclassified Bradyrhizobium]MCA1365449.1 DUF429 domain-containing protein [Bradyrhizobium sp. IC4059]MCA1523152.1 DUF429 domain-containing protein [Bradyrhizobium sp. IC3069]